MRSAASVMPGADQADTAASVPLPRAAAVITGSSRSASCPVQVGTANRIMSTSSSAASTVVTSRSSCASPMT